MKQNWFLTPEYEKGFGDGWGYNPLALQIFWNRQIKSREKAEFFLHPKYAELHDPYLFPDMRRAVDRIFEAVDKQETVFVYGDYDADGVPGAAILYSVLKAFGLTSRVYIPHREKEGYGVNLAAIDFMAAEGAKLFITCDCGISNNDATSYAAKKGLNCIITDHHTLPPELTKDAYAIIHPQVGEYPFKGLSGGAVAFKLAQGLLKAGRPLAVKESSESVEKWLLDLVAITTVADMMPLIDENRILVNFGLKVLNKTRRLGLKKLIEVAGLKFGGLDAYNIGFQIAPRINAAGRMDHANAAYELLICEDEVEAARLANNLNETNRERQRQTEIVVNEAKFQIVEKGQEKDFCLFGFSSSWPLGLLGLAAGRLSNAFNRPVILMTEINGEVKGSARGIDNWNVIAALQKIGDLFSHYGGHPAAAGMSLKNKEDVKLFEEKICALAREELQSKELESLLVIDAEIKIDAITLPLAEEVQKMEPFGEENPTPKILLKDLTVRGLQVVGNGSKHLRLTVSGNSGAQYKMMGFCQAHWCEVLKFGDHINAVCELGVNEWNGRREAQLKIADLEKV
jgi:single-stranded-DNA-specific exonuclease